MDGFSISALAIGRNVAGAINKKKFLRKLMSRQEEDAVAACAAMAVEKKKSVGITMLWGVGTRNHAGIWEKRALKQLALLDSAVREYWSLGSVFTVIFADIHSELNQTPSGIADKYLESLRPLLDSGPVATRVVLLSRLWRKAGFSINDVFSACNVAEKAASGCDFSRILESARKRFHGSDPEKGARLYITARMIDKKVIPFFYPRDIHGAYTAPGLAGCLLPREVPVIYLWSLGKGRSMPPWFFDNKGV